MITEDLKNNIISLLPNAVFEDLNELVTLQIDKGSWINFANKLKQEESLLFDYLFCITCVDFKVNLTMVYHLTSTKYRHNIVVKIILDSVNPNIETVSGIWKTAIFHERENYEMFGVNFTNHPDLRLLILPNGWEGKNPMRKDFEDPINMIKL